ncbi:MAG: TIGR03066 family protein [Gemmataceae bacterium]|nr:TIGR03066 family protein [Gemmataceae bacterium]
MRTVLGGVLAVGLAAAAATADDKKDPPVDGKKLIGKWEPKEAKKDPKTTIEFAKDAKLVLTVEAGGKAQRFEGTYKLDGNKLRMKMRLGEKEVDEEVAVLRLTDEEFETEDAKGKKETLTRVRANK